LYYQNSKKANNLHDLNSHVYLRLKISHYYPEFYWNINLFYANIVQNIGLSYFDLLTFYIKYDGNNMLKIVISCSLIDHLLEFFICYLSKYIHYASQFLHQIIVKYLNN